MKNVRTAWVKTLYGGAKSILDEALIWEDDMGDVVYRFYSAGYTSEEVISLFTRIVESEYEDYKRGEEE